MGNIMIPEPVRAVRTLEESIRLADGRRVTSVIATLPQVCARCSFRRMYGGLIIHPDETAIAWICDDCDREVRPPVPLAGEELAAMDRAIRASNGERLCIGGISLRADGMSRCDRCRRFAASVGHVRHPDGEKKVCDHCVGEVAPEQLPSKV